MATSLPRNESVFNFLMNEILVSRYVFGFCHVWKGSISHPEDSVRSTGTLPAHVPHIIQETWNMISVLQNFPFQAVCRLNGNGEYTRKLQKLQVYPRTTNSIDLCFENEKLGCKSAKSLSVMGRRHINSPLIFYYGIFLCLKYTRR
jgi:hypothetical protein